MTTFRELHAPGNPFVLANAWDIGSAKVLAALGAQAIGTSSAAHAFTLGLPDGGISRDQAMEHAQALAAATPLPVSGDFENGFGGDPETCAQTVRLAAEIGLAGISIEDTARGGGAAYPFALAVERIRAAAAAARALPRDFVLVARADGVMVGRYGMDEALKRIRAFDEAGADCLYVPFPPDLPALKQVIAATKKPVNVLIAGPWTGHDRKFYAGLGAGRLSLGSALARATQKVLLDAGRAVLGDGDFAPLAAGASGAEVNRLLAEGAASPARPA